MTQLTRIPLPPVIQPRDMYGYEAAPHGEVLYDRATLFQVAHCTQFLPTAIAPHTTYAERAEDQLVRRSRRLAAMYFLCAAETAPTTALAHYYHERACEAEAKAGEPRSCKVHVRSTGNNLTNP